jgi:hypothetical protein
MNLFGVLAGSAVRALALAALGLALLSACGGEAGDAVDVSAPKQLHGGWMAVSDGRLDGIEFLEEDQALLTAPGNTMRLGYQLLEGGRLALSDAYGKTTMFRATLADGTLELTAEGGNTRQRFRRLGKNETLAEAMREYEQQRQADMEQRVRALQALVEKGEVTLVSDVDPGLGVWRMAVQPDHPNHLTAFLESGQIVFDAMSQKDAYDPLTPERVLPFHGQGAPAGRRGNEIELTLRLDNPIEPAGQDQGAGTITLRLSGPLDKQTVKGSARLPGLSALNEVPLTLARDPKVHAAVSDKLKQQREHIAAEMQRMREFLGGRSSYSGQRTESQTGRTQEVSLVLEYDADAKRHEAELRIGERVDPSARAGIEMLLGEAVLYVVSSWGEQWRLSTGKADGQLSGRWRPNSRTDFIIHGELALQQQQRISEAQLAEERAAVERFVTQKMRTPQTFSGFMEVNRGRSSEHWPVWVELQTAADGRVSGRAWLLAQQQGMALEGNVAGDTFTLRSTQPMPGSTGRPMRQNWQLEIAGLAPAPMLRGKLSASTGMGGGSGPVELTAAAAGSDDRRSETPKALSDARFRVLDARGPEPSYFRIQADPASGKISGDVVGADLTGRRPSALPPGLISGQWRYEHGHGLLQLSVDGSPLPTSGGGRDGQNFEYTFAVADSEESGLRLVGWTLTAGGNTDWLSLAPVPATEIIEVSEEQRVRLAAQKLGAVVRPPDRPRPGDEALLLVLATERDARVGQIYHADGRYSHGNSPARAALHAGAMQVGETAVLRLRYGPPFPAPTAADERNGISSQRSHFKSTNSVPSFTIERVKLE